MKKISFAIISSTLLIASNCYSTEDNARSKYTTIVNENEVTLAKFSERILITELSYNKSKLLKKERDSCNFGCIKGLTLIDLTIGNLSVNNNSVALETLVNATVLNIDAGSYEDLDCAIVIHGSAILPQLKKFDFNRSLKNCHSVFNDLKKNELSNVNDVNIEDICLTHNEYNVKEANRHISDLINSIQMGTVCE